MSFLISFYNIFSLLIITIVEVFFQKKFWEIPNTEPQNKAGLDRSYQITRFLKDGSFPTHISIIIRTLNEEKFLGKTLEMVFKQSRQDFEVIVVDSGSSDETLKIVKEYPVTLVEIPPESFSFGYTLNLGARIGKGEIIVNLSAHAVPLNNNWLERLVGNLEKHPEAAGVYGRQLPNPDYCNPIEAKHLLDAYSKNKIIQKSNTFFSNANSAIRRPLWAKQMFDESLMWAEDQVWAKKIQEKGFVLIYDPEAMVYHSHNLSLRSAYKRAFLLGLTWPQIAGERKNFSRIEQLKKWWNLLQKANGFLLDGGGGNEKYYWLFAAPFYEFSSYAGFRDGLRANKL